MSPCYGLGCHSRCRCSIYLVHIVFVQPAVTRHCRSGQSPNRSHCSNDKATLPSPQNVFQPAAALNPKATSERPRPRRTSTTNPRTLWTLFDPRSAKDRSSLVAKELGATPTQDMPEWVVGGMSEDPFSARFRADTNQLPRSLLSKSVLATTCHCPFY